MKELELGEANEDIINEIHRGISSGTRNNTNPLEQRVVGKQIPHLSAMKQCTGDGNIRMICHASTESFMVHLYYQLGFMLLSISIVQRRIAIGYVDKHSISPELKHVGISQQR